MFSKVLYPTDFSENALKTLEYVKKLKEAGTKEIIVVHIYDKRKINSLWEINELIDYGPPRKEEKKVLDHVLKSTYKKIKKVEKDLLNIGFKVEAIVKVGDPAKEILHIADEQNVNLIVIGEKGENALVELFLGRTSVKVVRDAKIPVLVIKYEGDKK